MATTLKNTLAACAFALAAAGLCAAPAAMAAPESNHPKAEKVLKDQAKARAKAKKAAAADATPSEPEPDITDSVPTDYDCELGNKITIYQNVKDESAIALRWKKRLHRMTRVGTTTGAQRFENLTLGLVWIGIPTKGMLLDSKQGRQLANECKNAEQAKPVVVAAAVTATAETVAPVVK